MKSDQVRLHLVIDVTYELGRTDVRDLEKQLVAAADFLADNGKLSGETEASVENWTSSVLRVEDDAPQSPPAEQPKPESWLTRLHAEKVQLDERIGELAVVVARNSALFSPRDQELHILQLSAMRLYAEVLRSRREWAAAQGLLK